MIARPNEWTGRNQRRRVRPGEPLPFGPPTGHDLQVTTAPDQSPPTPLTACPACGCRDLFVRKDFPQKLGLTIVAAAAVAFLVLAARPGTFVIGVWVLVGATAADALLYWFVPKVTVCYRCRAEFRGVPVNPGHEGFDLAVGEKYRGGP